MRQRFTRLFPPASSSPQADSLDIPRFYGAVLDAQEFRRADGSICSNGARRHESF
ncbi:hypothetical protein NKDENANG_02365 [Candidatus Entotheonellaceae bacterium PAL068K]